MGHHWKLSGVLNLFYSNPYLRDLIVDDKKPCLILRGDAAAIGGKQCLLITLSLANLRHLCNVVRFQFIIGAGYANDKDQKNLALLLGEGLPLTDQNLATLQSIISKDPGKSVLDKLINFIQEMSTHENIYNFFYIAKVHFFTSTGYIEVNDEVLDPTIKFSADESYYRTLFGLVGPKSHYFCVKCYDHRGGPCVGLPRITKTISDEWLNV